MLPQAPWSDQRHKDFGPLLRSGVVGLFASFRLFVFLLNFRLFVAFRGFKLWMAFLDLSINFDF